MTDSKLPTISRPVELLTKINHDLTEHGVVILPPLDALDALALLQQLNLHAAMSMLDPWYNKGLGGELPDEEYDAFISKLLTGSAALSDVLYLWGFPEVIGPYVRFAPEKFAVTAWITWYYKNCPSVIRGWRSSQNACIQFTNKAAKLYPENFLNDEQRARLQTGKMRFVPGPTSVIEEPLIVGFVGKKERTGHPAQKPMAVFERLILMGTAPGDLIVDVLAGSGTTGAVALQHKRKAILCDQNPDYIAMMEKRLSLPRLDLTPYY